jgi:hypothetical protein
MRRHRSDPRHLVRCDRDSQARPADQQRAVRFAVADLLSGEEREVCVGGLVRG